MKQILNNCFVYIISFFPLLSFSQWPVNSGAQGNITGTIGEVRGGGTRIHNGTDIDWSPETVYSIQDDVIQFIGYATSNPNNKFIRMSSGIVYTHVTPLSSIAKNKAQYDAINAGKTVVTLTARQAFAQMIPSNSVHASHVHLSNAANENFLPDGFNVPGYTFKDKTDLAIGDAAEKKPIKIYVDKNPGDTKKEYTEFVENEKFTNDEKPLIIRGSVDIVVYAFQPWISSNGSSIGSGHLAPFKLGFKLATLKDGKPVFDDFERLKFDHGLAGDGLEVSNQTIINTIHAKGSTSSKPLWIITNKFVNGEVKDEALNTKDFADGDYKLTVKVEGAPNDLATRTKEKTFNVRIDNFKAYIQKVIVKNDKGEQKYFAEWSTLPPKSDGAINLIKRDSESFKGGTNVTIEVTSSEVLPALELELDKKNKITLQNEANDGITWKGSFVLPPTTNNKKSNKLQLIFTSGERLAEIAPNVDQANVTNNGTGKNHGAGNNKGTSDQNHILNICPTDYDLKLDIEVKTGTDATLIASGGTSPYLFSADEAPFNSKKKTAFTGNNTFTIDYDKNYLFKVKDQEGCVSEEYYTLPKVPCNATNFAGNQGTDIKQVNLGSTPGLVRVVYDMYSIPDQITVEYRGTSQTTGIVSGTGEISFQHTPKKGASNLCTITMYAPNPGTAWQYTVYCPTSSPVTARSSDVESSKLYTIKYNGKSTIIKPTKEDNNAYRLKYREAGSNSWIEYGEVKLPFKFDNQGKDLQFDLTPAKKITDIANSTSNSLKVFPNPSTGPLTIEYYSKSNDNVAISLINSNGQNILTKKQAVLRGRNIIRINPKNKLVGTFLIKVVKNGSSVSSKVLMIE